jgi:hypothetical protein
MTILAPSSKTSALQQDWQLPGVQLPRVRRRQIGKVCEVFQTPAHDDGCQVDRGPASERLQGRNPRELSSEGAAGAMGII